MDSEIINIDFMPTSDSIEGLTIRGLKKIGSFRKQEKQQRNAYTISEIKTMRTTRKRTEQMATTAYFVD